MSNQNLTQKIDNTKIDIRKSIYNELKHVISQFRRFKIIMSDEQKRVYRLAH